MKTKIISIQGLAFNDTQITIEGEHLTGELHLKASLQQLTEDPDSPLQVGAEMEIGPPTSILDDEGGEDALVAEITELNLKLTDANAKADELQKQLDDATAKVKALETLNTESAGAGI